MTNTPQDKLIMDQLNITASIETITPERAKQMLTQSNGNRSLKRAKISALKRDMLQDKFKLNGESIIFDCYGVLIDGHHRLTACKEACVSFSSIIVRGVTPKNKNTIDTGASRSICDHLSIDGKKNANLIPSITNILMSLSNGRAKSATPSASEVYEFAERHPEIEDAASFAATKHYPQITSVLGAIYFVAKINGEEETAKDFAKVFKTGIPKYTGCPAHLLRERMNKESMSTRKTSVRDLQKLTIAAWEKFRRGQPAKILRTPEEFRISGWS